MQKEEYDALIISAANPANSKEQAQTLLSSLKTKNQEIEATLNAMIAATQESQVPRGNSAKDLQDLIDTLSRIQRDYNGLSAGTDQLQTLRRIREHEESDSLKNVNAYIALLLASSLVLVFIMLWKTGSAYWSESPSGWFGSTSSSSSSDDSYFDSADDYADPSSALFDNNDYSTNPMMPATPNTAAAIPPFTQRAW